LNSLEHLAGSLLVHLNLNPNVLDGGHLFLDMDLELIVYTVGIFLDFFKGSIVPIKLSVHDQSDENDSDDYDICT